MPDLVLLGQKYELRTYIRLSRSLEVTRTDAGWSATYDFLLVIHSIGLSHNFFRSKRRFRSKFAIFFPTPDIYRHRYSEFYSKTRMIAYQRVEKLDDMWIHLDATAQRGAQVLKR